MDVWDVSWGELSLGNKTGQSTANAKSRQANKQHECNQHKTHLGYPQEWKPKPALQEEQGK